MGGILANHGLPLPADEDLKLNKELCDLPAEDAVLHSQASVSIELAVVRDVLQDVVFVPAAVSTAF
jgi:hypothetical protein